MRSRLPLLPLFLLAALLLLPACGSASSSTGGGGTSASTGGETTTIQTSTLPAAGDARPAGKLALRQIGKFDTPVFISGAPGFPKLLFVVEQEGRIAVLKNGRKLAQPFLDISDRVAFEGERGLLSVAFPGDYAKTGRFYVYYVDESGAIRIDELHSDSPVRASTAGERNVIRIPHPVNANHNGGQMEFLGDDLYFGTGDGGSGGDPPNNAQNRDVLLGKLLRIDPRPFAGKPYSVPATNPFVGAPGRDEIYSYGLRNPFRFSFDRVSAKGPRIAIGDVGQNKFEEVDYTTVAAARGANFGWDAWEGFKPYTDENSGTPDLGGTTKPISAYSHDRAGGSCSIIGGYVVADPQLKSLFRRYVYADYCEGELRSLNPHLRRASGDHKLGLSVSGPTSFGEDDAHHLYVASQEGPVYRLVEN